MSAKNNKNSRNNRSRHKNYIVAASVYGIKKLSSSFIFTIKCSYSSSWFDSNVE